MDVRTAEERLDLSFLGNASGDSPAGLLEQGNIDLTNRPIVHNEDGTISTVRTISTNIDGHEVLIPTVSDAGRIMGDEEAISSYQKTGRHFGKFDTPENATAYAENLHNQQAEAYGDAKAGLDLSFLDEPYAPQKTSAPVTPSRAIAEEFSPDQAAEARRLIEQLGMPPEVVFSDIGAARKLMEARKLQADMRDNPALAAWYEDPYYSAVSADDEPVLKKLLYGLKAAGDAVTGWQDSAVRAVRELPENFAHDYELGVREIRLNELAYEAMKDDTLLPRVLAEKKALEELRRKPSGWVDENILQPTAFQGAPFIVEGTKRALPGAMIGAGSAIIAGQMGPQIALPEELVTVPAAAVAGAGAAAAEWMMRVESGSNYLEFLEEKDLNGNPIDPAIAKYMALLGGMANALLEGVGAHAMGKAASPLIDRFRKDAIKTALKDPTFIAAAGNFFRNYGAVMVTEVGTENAQELVTVLAGRAAQNLNALMHGVPAGNPDWLKKLPGRLWDTTTGTLGAFGLLMLPGPSMRLSSDISAANRGRTHSDMMQAAIDAAAESKTRIRDPEAFEAFCRSGLPEEKRVQYIDAETLQTYYQTAEEEGGLVMPDMELLGIDDMAFAAALESGETLPIDTAKFLAHVPTETQKAMTRDLRADPLAMTVNEAAHRDLAAEARAIADAYRPDLSRAAEYAEEKQRITEELMAAGRAAEWAADEADILVMKSLTWERTYGFDGVAELRRRKFSYGGEGIISDTAIQDAVEETRPRDGGDIGQGAGETYFQPSRESVRLADEALRQDVAAWKKSVDTVAASGKAPSAPVKMLNQTPLIMRMLGTDTVTGKAASENGIYAAPHFFDGSHPNITPEMLQQIPAALADPIAVFDSDSASGRVNGDLVFMLEVKDANGATVIVPVAIDARGKLGARLNIAKSAYAKERGGKPVSAWFGTQAEKNARYVNGQKWKSWGIGSGATSPLVAANSSGNTVYTDADLVKLREANPTLYQEQEKTVRGATTPGRLEDIIQFFRLQNVSTAIHEFGHVFVADMERIIDIGDAPEGIRRDYAIVREFVGAEEGKKLTREQHEKFAKAFEAYLREGKSPSFELSGVFHRFRNWLTGLYRSAKQLDVTLSPEIRDVFDRLLATEEQFAETRAINEMAESEMKRLAAMAEEGGFSAQELATVNKAYEEAYREGQAAMDRAALRERAKQWREANAFAKDIVAGEPVYAAVDMIRASDLPPEMKGLNEAHIAENYSPEAVKEIRRKFKGIINNKGGGFGADVLAEELGFASGDALITALVDARTRRERINELAEQMIAAEEAAAMPDTAALASESYGKYLEKVSAILSKKLRGGTYSPREYLARTAQDYIGAMLVREATRYDAHQRAMRKHMADRLDAAKNHDARREMMALEKLRLAHQMVGKTLQVREQVAGVERRIQRIIKSKSINSQFRDQVLGLADRFTIGTAQKPRSPEHMVPLSEIVAGAENDFGWGVSFPEWLTNGTFRQDFRDLTVNEFGQLENLVRFLEKRGRDEFRESKESYAARVNLMVTDAVAPSRDMAPKPIYAEGSTWRNMTDASRKFFASLDSLQFLFRSFDGYQNTGPDGTRGPNEKLLFDRIIEGSNARKVRLEKINADLAPHLKQLGKSARAWEKKHGKRLLIDGVTVPSSLAGRGRGWSADAVIAMALHMGSDSNAARLRKGYPDLTPQTRDTLLGLLEEADWDAIQGIWDVFESQWADLDAVHYQVNGFHMAKIQAREFMPLGLEQRRIYKKYRGGYCPAIYDPDLSRFVREFSEAESIFAQTETVYQTPAARSGMTKARKNKAPGLPLLLSTSIISRHLQDTATYITLALPVRDADRVTRSAEYEGAFSRMLGREAYDQIRPALKDIVLPEKLNLDSFDALVEKARSYATPFYLAWNLKTAIMQFLSGPRGLHDIGVKNYARGLGYALTENPMEKIRWIMEVSPYMAERAVSRDRELAQMFRAFDINTRTFGVFGKDWSMADLVNIGFMPMMITDWVTAYPIWLGQYHAELKKNGGDQQAAVLAADDAVRFSQSSANVEDLPAFLRSGKGIKRLFSLFGTDNIGRYGQRQRYHYRAWRAGQMTTMGYAWFNMVEAILPAVGLRIFLELIWRGEPLPDDDDDKRWYDFLADIGNDVFLQGVPFVGNLFSSWRKPFDSPVGSMADRFVSSAKGVVKGVIDNDLDDAAEKAFMGLFEMMSIYSRIPASRISRNIEKGEKQYSRGDASPLVYLIPEPKN